MRSMMSSSNLLFLFPAILCNNFFLLIKCCLLPNVFFSIHLVKDFSCGYTHGSFQIIISYCHRLFPDSSFLPFPASDIICVPYLHPAPGPFPSFYSGKEVLHIILPTPSGNKLPSGPFHKSVPHDALRATHQNSQDMVQWHPVFPA